eukprot:NODE_366_length_10082_cov_0.124211.p2 type:complete len:420 gc:universal NODE_366_length_10082_cov_0.124211:9432-8173(-)
MFILILKLFYSIPTLAYTPPTKEALESDIKRLLPFVKDQNLHIKMVSSITEGYNSDALENTRRQLVDSIIQSSSLSEYKPIEVLISSVLKSDTDRLLSFIESANVPNDFTKVAKSHDKEINYRPSIKRQVRFRSYLIYEILKYRYVLNFDISPVKQVLHPVLLKVESLNKKVRRINKELSKMRLEPLALYKGMGFHDKEIELEQATKHLSEVRELSDKISKYNRIQETLNDPQVISDAEKMSLFHGLQGSQDRIEEINSKIKLEERHEISKKYLAELNDILRYMGETSFYNYENKDHKNSISNQHDLLQYGIDNAYDQLKNSEIPKHIIISSRVRLRDLTDALKKQKVDLKTGLQKTKVSSPIKIPGIYQSDSNLAVPETTRSSFAVPLLSFKPKVIGAVLKNEIAKPNSVKNQRALAY